MHGILWAHGQMINSGTLDGGPISLTTSVNDSAEVAGFALNTIPDPYSMFFGNQTRAYRWKNGVMRDLGTLGGPDAMALRINERGQIAGNSYINLDLSDFCGLRTGGFLWAHGKMADLRRVRGHVHHGQRLEQSWQSRRITSGGRSGATWPSLAKREND